MEQANACVIDAVAQRCYEVASSYSSTHEYDWWIGLGYGFVNERWRWFSSIRG
jgi:hypothetical protein